MPERKIAAVPSGGKSWLARSVSGSFGRWCRLLSRPLDLIHVGCSVWHKRSFVNVMFPYAAQAHAFIAKPISPEPHHCGPIQRASGRNLRPTAEEASAGTGDQVVGAESRGGAQQGPVVSLGARSPPAAAQLAGAGGSGAGGEAGVLAGRHSFGGKSFWEYHGRPLALNGAGCTPIPNGLSLLMPVDECFTHRRHRYKLGTGGDRPNGA